MEMIILYGGVITSINMSNKKQLLVFGMLGLGLMGGLLLTRQNQDTRRSAYFESTTASILPSTANLTVGQTLTANLWLNSAAKVDFVNTKVCSSSNSLVPVSGSVTIAAPFTNILQQTVVDGNCLAFKAKAEVPSAELRTGAYQVVSFKFVAMSATSAVNISMIMDGAEISGYNPTEGATDVSISLASAERANFAITAAGVNPTLTPTLTPTPGVSDTRVKFKVTSAGADSGTVSDSCSANLRVKVTVLSEGQDRRFDEVALTRVGTKDVNGANLVLWQGEVNLGSFPTTSKGALLVKGPKHVQMKYGASNQSDYYNESAGSLNITTATVNEFDFGGYPMMPGDIVSNSDSVATPDGIVNGRDYAYMVGKLLTEESKADLDFSCGVNVRDLNLLKITLNERQSQKY